MNRSLESTVQTQLARIFRERLGLELRPQACPATEHVDLGFMLERDGSERPVLVEVKSRVYGREIDRLREQRAEVERISPDAIFLVVAPRIGNRLGSALESAGLNYADLSGTVVIKALPLFIRVEGDRPSAAVPRRPSPDPFADKASLVLRALLEHPTKAWGITELAKHTDLTKGWASLVAREAADRGYAARVDGRVRLNDPVGLLRDWTLEYSWRDNGIESYVSAYAYDETLQYLPEVIEQARGPVALTLLAGLDRMAPHVRHEQIHLYVSSDVRAHFGAWVRQRLHAEPVNSGGNFHLLDPHYADSVFFGRRVVDRLPVVSPVQLYLDLLEYPVRGREGAAMLARTVLRQHLELSDDEVVRLANEER